MAGTVIDALFVSLGLKAGDFEKGVDDVLAKNKKLREDGDKTGKDVREGFNKATESVGKLKNEVLGVLAVIAGGRGLKDLFLGSVQVSAATGRMAHNIGISTQQLSAWNNMAVQAGGTAEGMTNSIFGLSQQIEGARMGIPSNAVAIMQRYMNIKTANPDGSMRSTSDIMLDIADYFSKHSPQQDSFLGAQLGFDQGTINTLEQGRAAVQAGLNSQGNVNPSAAAAAEALITSFAKLQTQVDQFANDLMVDVTPTLLSNMNNFTKGVWLIDQVLEGKISPMALLDPTHVLANVTGSPDQSVRDQVLDYFTTKGLSKTDAAAIAGNVARESNYDPTAVNPATGASGLFQWTGPRKAAFLKKYHTTPDQASVQQQLDFAWSELTTTERASLLALKASPDLASATTSFAGGFERPYAGMPAHAVAMDQTMRIRYAADAANASNNTQNVSIGEIIVNTTATTAKGIARDFKSELKAALKTQQRIVHQGNTGLN